MGKYEQETAKKEDKKPAVEGIEVTGQLENSSNELNNLLMDQSLSETDKQSANELLMTVQMTKEETKQTVQNENTLLNDDMKENVGQEGEPQAGMGPLAEEMGEIMGIKQEPDQPSFGVQTIETQLNTPVVNEQTAQAVAPQRGFFFRAFQKIMKAISFCMVTRHFAKWKHEGRSGTTLEEARRKAEEIASRINRPNGETEDAQASLLKAGAPVEQGQSLKNDPTRVPMVWEQAQGFGQQDPTVELHTQQGDMFSNEKGTNTTANSFVVLRYSKNDFRTGRIRRYRLAFGFAPRFEVDHDVLLGLAATIPGALQNQTNASSSVGRSYSISEQQVDAILSAAPKEADKGYNLITHNCTTFAVNLLGEIGVSEGGIQQEYMDAGGELELALPMAAARGARRLKGLRGDMLSQMEDDDYTLARQGKKQVDYKDMERFESSLNYDGPASLVGYEAGMVGEQLRGINAAGGSASSVAIADFESVASADGVAEKMEILNKYDGGKTAPKVYGIAGKLVKPIVALAQELETKAKGVTTNTLNVSRSGKGDFWETRKAYLNDHDKFDEQKNALTAAVHEWMGRLDGTAYRELQQLGYRLIGELDAIEAEYYKDYNESLASGRDITDKDSSIYNILKNAGIMNVDSRSMKKNPIYIREFAKVFGDDTIDDIEDMLGYYRTRHDTFFDHPDENERAINTINKKKAAVMDHFAAEQYKLNSNSLAQNANVSQALVNEAFATPSQESNIAKAPEQISALALMALIFPKAYDMMDTTRQFVQKMENRKPTFTRNAECRLAEVALIITTEGIEANQDGLFDKMIKAIAYSSKPPLDKSQVVQEVLGRLFNQFFVHITGEGASAFIKVLADPSKAPTPTEESRERHERALQKQAELVVQIGNIVDRVLSSK